MAKLRLSINSTDVLGVYGIVDIVFNGTTLVSSKQLSATVENLEYNVAGIDNTSNTLKISLLNDQAHDANSDGDFVDAGAGDQSMQAIVSALSYSINDTTYTTLLPQAATSYTVPSGPYVGNVLVLTESVTQFTSYGADHAITFNSDGIVNTEYCSGIRGKVLENGNYQNLLDGKTYDVDGNEVSAP
jgi:hypothetical protein